jgi:hypothetical protein
MSVWTQLGQSINGTAIGDLSGRSISVNAAGNRVVIGAPANNDGGISAGQVRVFEYDGSQWLQLGQSINGNISTQSGRSVSINSIGNRVAIGAPLESTNTGSVKIFEYDGSQWVQIGQTINGEAIGNQSGTAISLNATGNRIAIGAPFNSDGGTSAGHVRVYEYNGAIWVQIGQDINGTTNGEISGSSVALNSIGNRVVIGSPNFSTQKGRVRIFEFNGVTWSQIGSDILGEANFNVNGFSVSINSLGNRVASGSPGNNNAGLNSGQGRIFEYDGIQWLQIGQNIQGTTIFERTGASISLNSVGDIVIIGGPNYNTNTGLVRVFQYNNSQWTQLGQTIIGSTTNINSGFSVGINSSGFRIGIGSPDFPFVGGQVILYEYPIPTPSTYTPPSCCIATSCCDVNICNPNPQTSNYDNQNVVHEMSGIQLVQAVNNFYDNAANAGYVKPRNAAPIFKSYQQMMDWKQRQNRR